MKYSYIKPRVKSAFTEEMQLLVSFFSITLIMLFLTYLFLVYKNYTFVQNKKEMATHKVELEKSLNSMQSSILFIESQKVLSEKVTTDNIVLKESIKNLFDLVPLRITLSEAKLLKNGLILYGITPNKNVYNFMLQAPLRAIFHKTYSSFYPHKNGWLKFVSTNYVNSDEEFINED